MPPSWSPAPRPHTNPSATFPPYGSCVQASRSPTPTVSTCASIAMTRFPLPMRPSTFPSGSILTSSKPTRRISDSMRSITGFSCADSEGIATIRRRKSIISSSEARARATIFSASSRRSRLTLPLPGAASSRLLPDERLPSGQVAERGEVVVRRGRLPVRGRAGDRSAQLAERVLGSSAARVETGQVVANPRVVGVRRESLLDEGDGLRPLLLLVVLKSVLHDGQRPPDAVDPRELRDGVGLVVDAEIEVAVVHLV